MDAPNQESDASSGNDLSVLLSSHNKDSYKPHPVDISIELWNLKCRARVWPTKLFLSCG